MGKENFILVSLDDPKTKKLAQTISNESCKKILNYLAEKEATESELAEKLDVPISTVHYNLQQLTKSGLVLADEYHYSEKGKEVNHYKLANKYVIIAPKSTYGIKEKLKSVLPVAVLIAAGAGLLNLFSRKTLLESSTGAPEAARMFAEEAIADAAPKAAEIAAAPPVGEPNIALWFAVGATAAMILFVLIDYIRNRKG